jgi:hypothetical protein
METTEQNRQRKTTEKQIIFERGQKGLFFSYIIKNICWKVLGPGFGYFKYNCAFSRQIEDFAFCIVLFVTALFMKKI